MDGDDEFVVIVRLPGGLQRTGYVYRFYPIVGSFPDGWTMRLGNVILTTNHTPHNTHMRRDRTYYCDLILPVQPMPVNHPETDTDDDDTSQSTSVSSDDSDEDAAGPNAHDLGVDEDEVY